MGFDEALKPGESPEVVEGVVIELMPSGMYRLEITPGRHVLGHLAGAAKRSFVRLRAGDRVEVETSPHDAGRGRITKLIGKRK
jgi:translation initiation factor IF-1